MFCFQKHVAWYVLHVTECFQKYAARYMCHKIPYPTRFFSPTVHYIDTSVPPQVYQFRDNHETYILFVLFEDSL